jgi:hypothetical protein
MRKKNEDIDQELEDLRYPWIYRGEVFQDSQIGKYVGFVYVIENLLDGRRYIGQKLFTKAKTRMNNGKKVKSRVVSTWRDYYGSNEDIQNDVKLFGRGNFKRTILHLCESKSLMNYLELLEIVRNEALLGENFYNKWLSFKCSKKFLTTLNQNPENLC